MFGRILEHKITFGIAVAAVVAVIAVGSWFVFRPQARHYETAVVSTRDMQESVTSTGLVDSDEHVSLAFRANGTVASLNVKVGDAVLRGQTLARLDNSALAAQLAGARADVLSAEAGLSTAERGATTETRAVGDQSVAAAAAALATADNDAYLKTSDAIASKADLLFSNGTSPNPTLLLPTDSYTMTISLNNARLDMSTRLSRWKALLQSSSTDPALLSEASGDIAAVRDFLNALSGLVVRLNTLNSAFTQAQISNLQIAMNGAQSEANTAATGFNGAYEAWKTAEGQQAVVSAPSTPEAIQIAEAAVAKANATVESLSSQVVSGTIVAPFDGIVASVSVKQGQAVTAGAPEIDLISGGNYKIDIMVPENEIGLIAAGDPALVTFDAYGSGLAATGTIASIDLSPTVTNGVGAYKTTVTLPSTDARIRTGMTANVSVSGASKSGVIAVPSSAIVTTGTNSFVLMRQASGSFMDKPVMTGISDGHYTEIISGLAPGDIVAVFGQGDM